jgi:hypothetical protein
MACEEAEAQAEQAKTPSKASVFIKKSGEAIKKFITEAYHRIIQAVHRILARLGEMINSISNLGHRKDIKAPSQLVNPYNNIVKTMQEMSDDTSNYVIGIMNFEQAMQKVETAENAVRWNAQRAENARAKYKKIQENDILEGRTVLEWYNDNKNSVKFDATINPANEQKKLIKMRGTWNKLYSEMMREAKKLSNELSIGETFANNDDDANFAKNVRRYYQGVFNSNMQRVLIALQILSNLQTYLTGMLQLSKKWGDMDPDKVVREPVAGALQEHN